jgi:hypothetical protein
MQPNPNPWALGDAPAVRFTLVNSAEEIRLDLRKLPAAPEEPVLYALCGGETALNSLPDRIAWLGVKNPKVQLARYFLRDPGGRVPALKGSFSGPRQVVRSIQDFLESAARSGRPGVYLLALEPELWNGLAGRMAGMPPETADPAREPGFLRLFGAVAEPEELRAHFCGASPDHVLARQMIMRAASSDAPALITGETGTGKSRAARLIFECSARRGGRLVEVDCGSITPTLFESELFGYIKGAFTGADRDKPGLWETAHQGAIFLDEVGDMPLEQQVKVLRAIQTGKIRRVGDTRDRLFDVRVIAATNRNLASMLRAGTFRKDLYFRLCGFQIPLPPLSAHPEDVRALAESFWKRMRGPQAELTPDVLDSLEKSPFPGNVRMLKRVLEVVNDLMPSGQPEPAHVNYVLRLFSTAIESDLPAGGGPDEGELLRMDSLRRLRKLDQITGSIETRLRQCFDAAGGLKPAEAKPLRAEIPVWKMRLGGLTSERLPFRDRGLLDSTVALSSGLGALETAVNGEGGAAAGECFRQHVEPALNDILRRLFQQLETLA